MHDTIVWVARIAFAVMVISWLISWLLSRLGPRRSAKAILDTQKKLYSERHEYRTVSAHDFRDLDLAYYDETQAWLEAQGFRHLGDVENVTLARTMPRARAFIRSMVSADGTISAGVYDVRLKSWMRLLQRLFVLPRDMRTLDLETELSDGTFVATSNNLGADAMTPPPGLDRSLYPRETLPEELLSCHTRAVKQALASSPGVTAVAHRTLDELLEAEHRLQAMKNAHRKSIGYVDRRELARIDGGKNPQAAQELADEIEAIKAEEDER